MSQKVRVHSIRTRRFWNTTRGQSQKRSVRGIRTRAYRDKASRPSPRR